MSDVEQIVLLQGIMDLKEKAECGLEPVTAMVISAVIILVADLLARVWCRYRPWCDVEILTLARVLSIGLSIALAVCALVTQYNMGQYDLMCETYRTLYGPLPWEVA